MALGFDSGSSGLQYSVDTPWISGLGVDYSLGIDGLNLFLILLTAVLWIGGTAFAAFREQERPQLFFFLMLVAETATLGSFLAQDLLLFVLFFDFMLVPFYFLFGAWGSDREGGPTAAAATLKMMIYTLIGSLLMLVGAIATAIISADGGHLTFSIAAIQQQGLDVGSQRWIFWFFAAAFLVKMPAFLLHGWMPDAYRAAPLPVLVVFSGVLAKVGAYGFLRVVLPLFPDATVEFQEVILVIALASILYGSVMAFTQTNVRLIAGYSSVAQLGFITAGIFALRADGADGAILQMVNHGLVVAPLFVIVAILVERTGTEDIREMGGMALRAPVLAALFLIVALATLAMPGLGQLHRRVLHPQRPLPGEDRLRLHRDQRRRDVGLLRAAPLPARDAQPQAGRDRLAGDRPARRRRPGPARPLHPRPRPLPAADPPPHRPDRPADGRASVTGGAAPKRSWRARKKPNWTGYAPHGRRHELQRARTSTTPASRRSSPSPPASASSCSRRLQAAQARAPGLTLLTLATTAGLLIWQWGETKSLVTGALRIDDLAISISLIAILTRRPRGPALDPRAGGRGSRARRVPRAADRLGAGDGAARRRRRTWSPSSSRSRPSRSRSTSSAPPTCAARARSSRGSST